MGHNPNLSLTEWPFGCVDGTGPDLSRQVEEFQPTLHGLHPSTSKQAFVTFDAHFQADSPSPSCDPLGWYSVT